MTHDTLGKVEQGVPRRWTVRTARNVYQALAAVMPLTEEEAATYFAHTGMSPRLATSPGRLPDNEYITEAAYGRVRYQGSLPHQRPPVPHETIWLAGYRPGAGAPEAAELTVPVQQAIADLVVTVGPARAEAAIRTLIAVGAAGAAGGPGASVPPKGAKLGGPTPPEQIKAPPGSVGKVSGEGSKEFIPTTAQPKSKDPSKPQAQPIKRKGHA